MLKYSRRDFLKASGGALGAAVLGRQGLVCAKEPAKSKCTGFKYAMCNESMQGLSWEEQCQIIGNAGYKGVEIAAFTLVREGVQEIRPAERKKMVAAMSNAGIECAGLHWLLAPPPKGMHFTTPDTSVRKRTAAYLNELIDFCGELGGSAMIFGSPKQRNAVGISVDEAKRYFAEGLAAAADNAKEKGIKILIEPLDKSQTDVVNTMAEAVEMVRRIGHPAVQSMFDFHNTLDETEPFDVLIKKYYDYIHHVHVQEMDGSYLGAGTAVNDYVKAFQVLKDLNYDKWISLEVFDFSPGGRTIAEESMKALKRIEAGLV
jgi:sugar phosphate isomerase/epimerase